MRLKCLRFFSSAQEHLEFNLRPQISRLPFAAAHGHRSVHNWGALPYARCKAKFMHCIHVASRRRTELVDRGVLLRSRKGSVLFITLRLSCACRGDQVTASSPRSRPHIRYAGPEATVAAIGIRCRATGRIWNLSEPPAHVSQAGRLSGEETRLGATNM
jgi:hypothetical protein